MISYIFDCNCEYPEGAVPKTSGGKYLCPRHTRPMKERKIDCPECGGVEIVNKSGRMRELCRTCHTRWAKERKSAEGKKKYVAEKMEIAITGKKPRRKGFRDVECRTYDWCLNMDLRRLLSMDCSGCERKRGGARYGSPTATNTASGMVAHGQAGRTWSHGL